MSEGILGKLGGTDVSKMMLFMFLGLVIAILVLGFHRSPVAAPHTTNNLGTRATAQTPQLSYQVTGLQDFTESRIP